MRVAFPFEGYRTGGSHVSGSVLAAALEQVDKDVEPTIVLHQEGQLTDYLSSRGIAWSLLPTRFTGAALTKINYARVLAVDVPRMVRWLREAEIDIVHTNDSAMHVTWGAAVRAAGAQHVWHQRGCGWPRTPLNDLSETAVITISDYVLRSLPQKDFREVVRIYNPFDVSSPQPSKNAARAHLCTELRLPPATRVVGFVSNFRGYKRPQFYLQIAARVTASHDCHFVLIGTEYDIAESDLRSLAHELGLAQRVSFLGFRVDAASLMRGLDVLVAPAVGEPFGRTLVESFLAQTPVVAAASGGHLEIVPPHLERYLVPPDDISAFVEQITDLLDDESLYREVAETARRHAVEVFDVQRHVKQVIELYGRVVHDRSGGAVE